jgi:hypothetical protein
MGREPTHPGPSGKRCFEHHPRHKAVLELAAEAAGWGDPLPKGNGRGIAVAEAFGTYVAQVAEVTVAPNGDIKVDRVVCAVDCGTPSNPDVITGQMEGGIGFGLGAALYGAITLKDGKVEQTNFNSYQVLCIDEMPKVDVHIVQSPEAPTGVGEPGGSDRGRPLPTLSSPPPASGCALRISYRRGSLIRCLSIKGSRRHRPKFARPLRPPLPASCPLQHRIGHECRHRLPNRGIVAALQLVLARQQEIDHLLTEFDLDRPQPQPPAFSRFANAFPCRCNRHGPRL